MIFTCDSAELSDACQNVQRAASVKTSIPAIEGILVSAKDGVLTLTGYDLETGIITSIPARTDENGEIVLNARTFSETLRRLPESVVSVRVDERNIAYISCGDFKSSLIGISAEEYPDLPAVLGGNRVVVERETLKDMIRRTIFSVAVRDVKIIHTGIRFEIEKNRIRLIAVDGVRLAVRTENIEYDGEEISFVVPAKALSEVVKLLGDGDGEISLDAGKRLVIFEIDGYKVVSRLLEGEFLNYRTAIPSSNKTSVDVDPKKLADSVERTSLIITDKIKSPVKCVFENNYIRTSSATSLGTASDKIPAQIEGESCSVGFNNRYMLEALRVCDGDEVRILLNGAISPILIVPPQGDEFLFLILPVRLKNED